LKAAEAVVAIRKVAYAYSDSQRRGTLAGFRLRGAIPIYKHSYKRAAKADTDAAWNIRARARGDAPMVARSLQRQAPVVRG
jgi:hypothetical protein